MGKMKIAAAAAAAALLSLGGYEIISAANVYTLDAVTVTASRYEKKDLDVPASTQVITGEELKQTGAVNLQKALAFSDGIVYQQMGPGGAALSSMTSKIIMRGMEDGTLILVNGTPVNWRGKYNLEDFPLDTIDRVEIVRGGGSVLYGSQATGGVINIITKSAASNEAHVGFGNYGQQNHGATVSAGPVSVSYNYNKWDEVGYVSKLLSSGKETRNKFTGSEKNDIFLTYRMNDKVNFLYNHDESWNTWEYFFVKGYGSLDNAMRYNRLYTRTKDFWQANLEDGKGLTGHVYYLRDKQDGAGQNFWDKYGKKPDYTKVNTKDTITNYGYDLQKVWEGDLQTFLLGTSYNKEKWQTRDLFTPKNNAKYERNVYSFFGQWDRPVTEKDRLILSARETWTTGAAEDKNYTNFSGQAQYLHKISDSESLYASAGQSFVMPSFSNMYSTGEGSNRIVGNPNLKPLRGTHYEAGWKKADGKAQYKVAAFLSRTKDDLSFSKGTKATGDSDVWYVNNQDTKNKGIEASVSVQEDNGFSWHYGVTYNNPQAKVNSNKTGAKTYWDRMYGRWQMNAGLSYQKDKWSASLNGTYLFDRVMTPTTEHSYETKPYLLTSLDVQYSPNKNQTISLSVDNLLDREDNVGHTSSYYYATPINYLLSYSYKF